MTSPTRQDGLLNLVNDGKAEVQTAILPKHGCSTSACSAVPVVPPVGPTVWNVVMLGNTQVLYGGHATVLERKSLSVTKADSDDGRQLILQTDCSAIPEVSGTRQAYPLKTFADVVNVGLQSHSAGQQLASEH